MRTSRPTRRLWDLIKENYSFLVVIAATFLALALIVFLTFGSFYKSSRENAVTIGNMTVAQEARRIEDALLSSKNTLLVSSYTVDSMLERGEDAQQVESYLTQETEGIIMGMNPNFSGIYGVIRDEYVDGVGWQPEAGYDPHSRPWYIAATEKDGELAIVSPYVDAQTNSVMVSFSKLLCDGKSAISLDLRLDDIYAVTETIQLNGKGYCFLADSNGQIIAHRDQSQVGKNYLSDPEFEGTDIQALMKTICAPSNAETMRNVRIDGSDCMVFAQNVQGEWNVVLMVSSADLFKDIRADLVRNIVISLAIFILVGYFCTSNYRNKKRAVSYAENIRTDDLTGLNNRGEFDRYLRTTINSIGLEKKLYLLIFDADSFKKINDKYGHQEGDRALCLIACAMKEQCHGTDWFCARYGGDEFVIICKCNSDDEVSSAIAGLNQKLKTLCDEKHLPYSISLSCGYACYDRTTQSVTELVDKADQNLYQMKAEREHR